MSVRFLTSEDLAERWHTTPQAIKMRRHRGDMPKGYRIGRRVLYRSDEVEAWEAGRSDDGDRGPT